MMQLLISEANGFPYSFRKAIEIKKKSINRDLALNRDAGDIPINPIYNNLKLKNSKNIFSSVKLRSSGHIFNEN
jgi:hypothetical protein